MLDCTVSLIPSPRASQKVCITPVIVYRRIFAINVEGALSAALLHDVGDNAAEVVMLYGRSHFLVP